jgi:signal transduction histidine kinase/ligand-binding sensor domain-containing protein
MSRAGFLRAVSIRAGVAVALLWPAEHSARAEKLPVTIYTTAQGLPHNSVTKILPDSRGLIWFGTREGLSRFDGYTFVNYGVDDGLPSAAITDILETRRGAYLIATTAGLARFEMAPRRGPGGKRDGRWPPLFSVHDVGDTPQSRYVLALYEDHRGKVWVGTRDGLFVVETAAGDRMTFRRVNVGPPQLDQPPYVFSIKEDRFGSLWVGMPAGAQRIWPDGRVETHPAGADVLSILDDRTGHVWLGTQLRGLVELTVVEPSGRVASSTTYDSRSGLGSNWITSLFEPHPGELWAGSTAGLIQLVTTAGEPRNFRLLSEQHGLGRGEIQTIAADRNGNVWLGAHRSGAAKITPAGFSIFGAEDGIVWGKDLRQTRSGDLCFVGPTNATAEWGLQCFNGKSFDAIRPAFTTNHGTMSWGWKHTVLETRTGEWWFTSREGVARFATASRPHQLRGRSPTTWYAKADGLPANVILCLFEDSRGGVWISSVGEGARNGISRWDPSTRMFHHFLNEPRLPDLKAHYAGVFAEDRAGNVWIGFSGNAGIARYRGEKFEHFGDRHLFPAAIKDLLIDSAGRLWIGSYAGLVRVDDPAIEAPIFRRYTTSDGLSSNETTALVEDLKGRMFVGTARGLDRLDPATGRIKHFSFSDGLPLGEILSALLDRRTGYLWFALATGPVVRLVPPAESTPDPPPIVITAVQVDNDPQPLHPLGERTVPSMELGHDRNRLKIDFVAVGFGAGEDLRYQYRLLGAGDAWTTPSNQRTVNFANLAPGLYEFAVRAVNADGMVSTEPATMTFTITPPLWRRWWFLALVTSGAAASLYGLYRYRLARVLEIATLRARIATDLHDDIGANLTKIAILSEVTRQQLEADGEVGERLSTIARISRESVASMSDVVWAINPKRDTLRDTFRRMRQHAEEVVGGPRVALEFHAPEVDERLPIPIDVRRDFFLIFKEALNNSIRHSQCDKVSIHVNVYHWGLQLRLTDNGVGFDPNAEAAGNGLASMRRRAMKMRAQLEVLSIPGQGTTVSLSAPCALSGRLRHPPECVGDVPRLQR